MYVNCPIQENNLSIGTIVTYDSNSGYWISAVNMNSVVGCITREAHQDENGAWWVQVTFTGECHALAAQSIPREGGFMMVSNGRVYANPTESGCGIISPAIPQQLERPEGALVMVSLR